MKKNFTCYALAFLIYFSLSNTINGFGQSGGTIGSNQTICSGQIPIAFTSSAPASGGTGVLTYQWEKSTTGCAGAFTSIPGTNSTTFAEGALSATTSYHRKATFSTSGVTVFSNCITVTVNPTPIVIPVSTQMTCSGDVIFISLSSNVAGATFSWTIGSVKGGVTGAINGSGNVIAHTLTVPGTTSGTVLYNITATANGCSGPIQSVTVLVKPKPTVTTSTPQNTCSGNVTNIANTANIAGSTFSWTLGTITGGVTGASAGSGTAISQTLSTPSPTNGSVIYNVTATLNGCSGLSKAITVNVNAIPFVVSVSNQTVCAGASVNIFPTIIPAGAAYTWTNSNTAIGLPTVGFNFIPQFTATNSTTNPITSAIVIIPDNNGCPGPLLTFTITVNPAPTVTPELDLSFCSNNSVPLNTFSSTPLGATFAWTNSNTSIGLAASGSGSTPAFLASNITTGPVTSTVTVTPTLNSCVGVPEVFTITVNPTPMVFATSNQPVCAGALVNIFLSLIPAGATYTWTNSNPSIGLQPAGTGFIPPFTAINSTSSPVNSIIIITPIFNGCIGSPYTIVVTVNPIPIATPEPNVSVCKGTVVSSNTFTSTPSGATFTWTNSNTSIGLAANGLGSVPSFIATNTTTSVLNGTITVSPSLNGCSGPPITYKITVNPLPSPAISAGGPISFCSGGSVLLTTTNTVGASYQWKRYGVIIPGATTNSYTAVTSGTYKVTKINAAGCSGTSAGLVVTVNALPTASVSPVGPVTFCNGDSVLLKTNFNTNYAYQWKRNNSNISGGTLFKYAAKTQGSYTVKATNINTGCTKISNAVSVFVPCREGDITTDVSGNEMGVYPNPTSDQFTVKRNNENGSPILIALFDISGRQIWERKWLTQEESFQFGSNLVPGIYFLRANESNQWIKLCKTR